MDLIPKDPFTEALLKLGLGLQTVDTAKITLKKSGMNLSLNVLYAINVFPRSNIQ